MSEMGYNKTRRTIGGLRFRGGVLYRGGFRTTGGSRTTRDDSLNVLPPLSASSPTFLSTFDLESRYPIFSTFCDYLSIAEIVSLTQTCKKFSGLYQYLWDVDKALRRYFNDPYGFRSQMAKHDALIIDEFATKFFKRADWKVDCLSVTIRNGFGVDPFSNYLSETEGDTHMEVTYWAFYDKCLHEVREFRRDADGDVKICLFVTDCPPAQFVLLNITHTAEVNFISWNKAYSVFALTTFILNDTYFLHKVHYKTRRATDKFFQLGWNVHGEMWPEEKRLNHPIRERRRVGDRYTWTIPFDTRQVESSKTPDYVLEHACFTMDLSDGQRAVQNYAISVDTLESKVLKYTYLHGNDGMMDFIFPLIHSSTISELRKLDLAQRPTNYNQIMANPHDIDGALGDFDPPASWKYLDDDFPTWYKDFEKYNPESEFSE